MIEGMKQTWLFFSPDVFGYFLLALLVLSIGYLAVRTDRERRVFWVWYPLVCAFVLLNPLTGAVALKGDKLMTYIEDYYKRFWNMVPTPLIIAFAAVILVRQVEKRNRVKVILLLTAVIVIGGNNININRSPIIGEGEIIWGVPYDAEKMMPEMRETVEIALADSKECGVKTTKIMSDRYVRHEVMQMYATIKAARNPKYFEVLDYSVEDIAKKAEQKGCTHIIYPNWRDKKGEAFEDYGCKKLAVSKNGAYDVYRVEDVVSKKRKK